jgi:hypothetical protein
MVPIGSWQRSLLLLATALCMFPRAVNASFTVCRKNECRRQGQISFSVVAATTTAFRRQSLQQQQQQQQQHQQHTILGAESSEKKKKFGDPVREATGKRPSLHPVTINAIAEALKIRAQNLPDAPLRQVSDDEKTVVVAPLQIALTASKIAADAVKRRQEASLATNDGMTLTLIEEQTIAGRVLGVLMRLTQLEAELCQKCIKTPWIAKYNEWAAFGVVEPPKEEQVVIMDTRTAAAAAAANIDGDVVTDERILQDPLFAMNRAECLLALFLQTVERVELEKIGQSVPDNSVIDFLDADRSEVLLEFL